MITKNSPETKHFYFSLLACVAIVGTWWEYLHEAAGPEDKTDNRQT